MTASVIVPSWNGAARLRLLLPSLGMSSQVIVVDNGSTDGTKELLGKQLPRRRRAEPLAQ